MNTIETPCPGEGRFARQSRECVAFARVRVEVSQASDETRVEIALDNDESNKQFRRGNFSDWFAGAVYGAEFALIVANVNAARVRVRLIAGQDVDTTSTTVAAASAFAVWNALEFAPSPELLARIEERVCRADWQTLNDFDEL